MATSTDSPDSPKSLGVLIVDDDDLVRQVLQNVLTRAGWTVWVATDGVQALSTYQTRQSDIAVVLIDFHIPGIDGLETLEFLRQINPGVLCCFMSGALNAALRTRLQDEGVNWVINKPFNTSQLSTYLHDMVAAHGRD